MIDAYIYDAVRTPRGKGKRGSLHSVTPVNLAVTALNAVRDRNDLDTSYVDDVILGCVDPVGEQGANIARTAVINAGYAESVAGVQINRFCASGLEAVNMAAAEVMADQSEISSWPSPPSSGLDSTRRCETLIPSAARSSTAVPPSLTPSAARSHSAGTDSSGHTCS